jgi:hypothetical protein
MWVVSLICSDPACGEATEVVVTTLDEAERVVCDCGCCLVTLAVAGFAPVYGAAMTLP